MSTDLVSRTHKALQTTFDTTKVKEAIAKQGNIIKIKSSEESKALFATELRRYATVVKRAGVVQT